MATAQPAYSSTTTPLEQKSSKFGHLGIPGFSFKLAEVLISFIAFVLEEVVSTCNACSKLYFFEFVSCTAFLFTLLLLILLASSLHKKVGIAQWDRLDLGYTAVITFLFLLASALFLHDNSGSDVERWAGVFGIFASIIFLANVIYLAVTKRDVIFGKTTEKPTSQPQQIQPENPEREKLNDGERP